MVCQTLRGSYFRTLCGGAIGNQVNNLGANMPENDKELSSMIYRVRMRHPIRYQDYKGCLIQQLPDDEQDQQNQQVEDDNAGKQQR